MSCAPGGPGPLATTPPVWKEFHCSTHIWSAGPPASGGTGAAVTLVESCEPAGADEAVSSRVGDDFRVELSPEESVGAPVVSWVWSFTGGVDWSPGVVVVSPCPGSLGGVSGGVGGGGSTGVPPVSSVVPVDPPVSVGV
jgi:hypothetical protein